MRSQLCAIARAPVSWAGSSDRQSPDGRYLVSFTANKGQAKAGASDSAIPLANIRERVA